MNKTDKPTSILFDGGCHLCSREIGHYRKLNRAGHLEFIDITDPNFDAEAHGVQTKAIHRDMHVRRPDGEWATGVDAFIAIWERLPRYQWAAKLARRGPVKLALRAGYGVFKRVRPLLPRRARNACTSAAG